MESVEEHTERYGGTVFARETIKADTSHKLGGSVLLRQKELMIVVHGAHNRIVLRNNDIVHITVIDDGNNNTIDLTQQLLQRTSMETGPTTRICLPTMTAPLCFCCIDEVATKVFQPCGHYGVCTKCANNSQMKCPICRQRCHTASLFVVST